MNNDLESNFYYPGVSIKPVTQRERYVDYRLSQIVKPYGYEIDYIQLYDNRESGILAWVILVNQDNEDFLIQFNPVRHIYMPTSSDDDPDNVLNPNQTIIYFSADLIIRYTLKSGADWKLPSFMRPTWVSIEKEEGSLSYHGPIIEWTEETNDFWFVKMPEGRFETKWIEPNREGTSFGWELLRKWGWRK